MEGSPIPSNTYTYLRYLSSAPSRRGQPDNGIAQAHFLGANHFREQQVM